MIPVLVGGATMPSESELSEPLRELARRNAFEISDHRWKIDIERLTEMVRRAAGLPEPPGAPSPEKPEPASSKPAHLRPYVVGGAIAILFLLVWTGLPRDDRDLRR